MKKLFIFTIIVSFISAACPNNSEITPPAPIVSGINSCSAATKHLQDLCSADEVHNNYCCETVKDTKKGLDFTTFCKQTMSKGIDLHPQCLAQINSCVEIDVCTKSQAK